MKRCRHCEAEAVAILPQFRLFLCQEHFLSWFENQVERTIRQYHMFTRQEAVLVAISGGKDSLALWDVLLRLGYRADGIHIDLGINGKTNFSEASVAKVRQFLTQHPEARLHQFALQDLIGMTIPELVRRTQRGRRKPCSLCGLVKRHELNRLAQKLGYNVLATGHNLDDEVALLFLNVLQWNLGYLARQYPVLAEENGFARKVKPFCRMYEEHIQLYAKLRGIESVDTSCPLSRGANTPVYKNLWDQLEQERPGAKLSFYLSFLRAKDEEQFLESWKQTHVRLQPCPRCGQPTAVPELCAFCRTITQALEKKKTPSS